MKLESRRLLKLATFTLPIINLVLHNVRGKFGRENKVYYGLSESEGLFLENLIYPIYYNSNILQHHSVEYFTC